MRAEVRNLARNRRFLRARAREGTWSKSAALLSVTEVRRELFETWSTGERSARAERERSVAFDRRPLFSPLERFGWIFDFGTRLRVLWSASDVLSDAPSCGVRASSVAPSIVSESARARVGTRPRREIQKNPIVSFSPQAATEKSHDAETRALEVRLRGELEVRHSPRLVSIQKLNFFSKHSTETHTAAHVWNFRRLWSACDR